MSKSLNQMLIDLIAIPSVSNNPKALKEAIAYVSALAQEAGLHVSTFEKNEKPSIVISQNPSKNFSLLLNGHLDVVPAGDELFRPVVKDGSIYGRGAYDMKGSIAVLLKLMIDLKKENKLPETVGLMLVTDEEIGGKDGTGHLAQSEGIGCDFFLAGEPTDLNIGTKQKGVLWVEVTVKGKAAHGSMPWFGDNAITKLAHHISEFYSKRKVTQEIWQTTYNLSEITGGNGKNVVPEKATAFFDIRRIESDSADSILEELKQGFPKAEIKVITNEPNLYTKENDTRIGHLKRIVFEETGNEAKIVGLHFASDGRYFAKHNTPAINFGISGGGMHEIDEWVSVDSLEQYYSIMRRFILQFQDK